MTLPGKVDLTPTQVLMKSRVIGETGYSDNEEFELTLIYTSGAIEVNYVGESGAMLTDEQVDFIVNNSEKFI